MTWMAAAMSYLYTDIKLMSRKIILSVMRPASIVIGLGMAAIAARSMTNLLYGFQPHYGPTASAVAGIFPADAG